MARKKKQQLKIVGLVLLVVGVGLAIWGYQLSGAVGSQLTKAISGSPTDRVMMMYIGGAAAVVAGLFLLSKK
ncbi:MAG: DUF3185 family protein [Desulfobulbaceae bacterium]|nr:DUF3185 family protein [Desulfobulbaceae bacterium]